MSDADASYVISPISQSPFGLGSNLKFVPDGFIRYGILSASQNKLYGHVF